MSFFVFGITLEAINDPKELSGIPFTPWDFLWYGLIAAAIPTLIFFVRKHDPRKTLPGKWTSQVTHNGTRFRTALRLDPDGNAGIHTKEKGADSEQQLHTSVEWQLLDNQTLHLRGTQSVTWKILKLNRWSMITASSADSDFVVHWLKRLKVDARACLLIAAAALLPVLLALSLPRSVPSHAIADDPERTPFDTLVHSPVEKDEKK